MEKDCKYFLLMDKKSGRLVSGHNFSYDPPHAIYADEWHAPKLISSHDLEIELYKRRVNLKRYKLLSVTNDELTSFLINIPPNNLL